MPISFSETFANQGFGDITNGNDAAAAEDDAFDFRGVVSKTKHTAGGDKLGNLCSGEREAAIAKTKQDEGLQPGIGDEGHWVKLASVLSTPVRLLLVVESSRSGSKSESSVDGDIAASRTNNSSGVKNPSGLTTGTTT